MDTYKQNNRHLKCGNAIQTTVGELIAAVYDAMNEDGAGDLASEILPADVLFDVLSRRLLFTSATFV